MTRRAQFSLINICLTGLFLLASGCELIDPNPGPTPFADRNGPIAPDDSTVAPPVDTIPASEARGEELYVQLCQRCHGPEGTGGIVWPANIQGRTGIHGLVREGRRGMPGFPQLSDSAIKSIELYLGSFGVDHSTKSGEELYTIYCSSCHGSDATGTNIYAGSIQSYRPIHDIVRNGQGEMDPVDIPNSLIDRIQEYLLGFQIDFSTLTGREYYDRLCASCHGLQGEGSVRGPEIRNPVRGYAEYVIRTGRPGIPWFTKEMPRYGTDSLSNEQMTEIIDWLRSATKPVDGRSLYNRFCSTCHGFEGTGGPVDEDIDGKEYGDVYEKIREGKGGNDYADRKDYMPAWGPGEITDDEIRKMADYLRRLDDD